MSSEEQVTSEFEVRWVYRTGIDYTGSIVHKILLVGLLTLALLLPYDKIFGSYTPIGLPLGVVFTR